MRVRRTLARKWKTGAGEVGKKRRSESWSAGPAGGAKSESPGRKGYKAGESNRGRWACWTGSKEREKRVSQS